MRPGCSSDEKPGNEFIRGFLRLCLHKFFPKPELNRVSLRCSEWWQGMAMLRFAQGSGYMLSTSKGQLQRHPEFITQHGFTIALWLDSSRQTHCGRNIDFPENSANKSKKQKFSKVSTFGTLLLQSLRSTIYSSIFHNDANLFTLPF